MQITPQRVREWQQPNQPSTINPDTPSNPELEEAAKVLNTSPKDLPDRVRKLDEKVRQLEGNVTSLRKRWANLWIDKHRTTETSGDPLLLVADLKNGELADAKALAKATTNRDNIVLVALASHQGSFAVGVGNGGLSRLKARDIADQIVNNAGGGCGGDESVATGGGAEPDELLRAIDAFRTDIETEFSNLYEVDVDVISEQ